MLDANFLDNSTQAQMPALCQRLAGDPSGEELQRLIARLRLGMSRIEKELSSGATPAEFRRLDVLYTAYEAALEALPKLWEKLQTKTT